MGNSFHTEHLASTITRNFKYFKVYFYSFLSGVAVPKLNLCHREGIEKQMEGRCKRITVEGNRHVAIVHNG